MKNKSQGVGGWSQTLDALLDNLARTGRGRKQIFSILIDAAVALASLWVAFALTTNESATVMQGTGYVFLIVPIATVATFSSLGIYRWVVRSINRRLYNQLLKGCLLASLVMMTVMYLFPVSESNPRTVIVVFGLLLVIGTVSLRFLWHGLFDTAHRGEPIAIYGAGVAGRQLASLMSLASEYRPVLFLDDDPVFHESTVAGVRVVNGCHPRLAEILNSYEIGRIVLAIPSIRAQDYRSIFERLAHMKVHMQTIPSVSELMTGAASHDEIRDVSITDILGRDEVVPDASILGGCVRDKVVLVTGGGGSIGSELCRQILSLGPRLLIVLDISEASLYQTTESLHQLSRNRNLPEGLFKSVLCSVNDRDSLNRLFSEHTIDAVYHAAAYKHVPIVEAQPEQGVNVNVFGTRTVLDTAIAHRCSRFILVSTDKAVRPTNSMGASKRVAEMVLQARQRDPDNQTCIAMVRFGNVLGSSGSVVPKFRQQIQSGGPITITDKAITRYFMTIPEASQLVLQASAVAEGGEVFVLDMGEPVRIVDLAETMVRLYGKRLKRESGLDEDIDIQVVGLRPGEKLFEEMFIDDSHQPTGVSKIWTADEAWLPWKELESEIEVLQRMVLAQDRAGLRQRLLALALAHEAPDHRLARVEAGSVVAVEPAHKQDSQLLPSMT